MISYTVHGTRLTLLQGDLTDARVDAVVNAANGSLMGGGGVDGAIHRRGGPAILKACKALRETRYPDGLPAGEAVITPGGDLPARYVIHTVGPIWRGGTQNEAALLATAYRNSLARAREYDLSTVAFPSISTGAYGYPIDKAASTALRTVLSDLRTHPGVFSEVRFVLFTPGDLTAYASALKEVTRR